VAEIVVTEESLTAALHGAFEWQYDSCDHGDYSGGAQAGLPYKMCEIFARRVIETAGVVRDSRADRVGLLLAGTIDIASPGSLVSRIWAELYPGDTTAPSPVDGADATQVRGG